MNISKDNIVVLNSVSCEDVAKKLGFDICKHKTKCFMHDDHHPSLGFWGENREHWHCYVCDEGGGPISFVQKSTGLDFIDACKWISAVFGIPIGDDNKTSSYRKTTIKRSYKKVIVRRTFDSFVAQKLLDYASLGTIAKSFLFDKRKLHPQIIDELHIKSIEDANIIKSLFNDFDQSRLENSGIVTMTKGNAYLKFFTPCLLFPYYDRNNCLVGLQSRYLGDKEEAPRFQFVSSMQTRLFNLPILNSLDEGCEIYVSEGITDCLSLLSEGKKAVAIPSATILPEIDLMELLPFKIKMYPDNDEAGQIVYKKLRHFFVDMSVSIKAIPLDEGYKDYSEYYQKSR